MEPVKSLYQRINAIKKKIDYIQKDKKVESYMAVTHDAVTAATRKLFVEEGVLVVPSEISNVVVVAGATSKGTPIIRYEALFSVAFINIDSGDDRLIINVTAHAMDHGDKAPGKAISYAVKYAILKVLQLETGEDDESRAASEGIGDDLISKAKIEIDAASTPDELKTVWANIVTVCKEAKDMEAYNHLKKLVSERGAALKVKK